MPQDEVKFSVWLIDADCLRRVQDDKAPYYVIQDEGTDMSQHGWVKVANCVQELERPNVESLRKAFIETLEAKRSKTYADAEAKATEITKVINQLLTIGFDAPVEAKPWPSTHDDIPF